MHYNSVLNSCDFRDTQVYVMLSVLYDNLEHAMALLDTTNSESTSRQNA